MRKKLKDYLFVIIIFAVIFTKLVIVDVVTVKGISMQPTLNDKDKLIVEKISQYSNNFDRGDIVILLMDKNNKEFWVKRIVALEGDTIEVKDNKVYVNDEIIREDYIPKDSVTSNISKSIVPKGHMYVLGDNREHSGDSRAVGFIDYDKVVGNVLFKFGLIK
ncbi:signal peptidase I [Clostridium tarantellae]|uniref:Signal peptidase I n=1 Tax=Clostridium tarantellae TaxID=39493 RepID=A0A6I1MLJ3_9CLOT|nr:signal peptidase I [Clostridium tarantellae]MPQ43288.1 signal peptidase I [Clostridium tarantellae]